MTKHLRFLFVMLLAMIWSAGWAQTTIWSEDWGGREADTQPKDIKYDNVVYGNTSDYTKIYNEKRAGGSAPELLLYAKKNPKDTWTVTINDLKGCSGEFSLSLYTNNDGLSSIKVNGTKVALSAFTKSGVNRTATFTVAKGSSSLKLEFSPSSNTRIDNVVLTATSAGESKTDTKVSFGQSSGQTFTFTEGKYSNGTFTTPTATETNSVAGTVAYSSSNATAISVDSSTGALTFPGYGTATITATFTPNDTEKYAESTDSYIVVNKHDVGDAVFYESFDKCAGKGGNDNKFSSLSGGTDLSSTYTDNEGWNSIKGFVASKCVRFGSGDNAGSATTPSITVTGKGDLSFMAAAWKGDGTTITVSVSDGATLTYNGKTSSSISVNINRESWTNIDNIEISGAKTFTITFAANGKNNRFFLDEVMVKNLAESGETTTITLYENSESNTIEAKNGVNVTLKRSMVANEWNTICLPFDVSKEKAQKAFGEGVKIAQLDDKNSTGTTLKFVDMTDYGMQATVPYLIKPSKENTSNEYVFENVNVVADDINKKYEITEGYLAFKGIYNMMDITKDVVDNVDATYYAAFLGAGNKIYKADGSGNKTKGFRAYFAIPNGAAASALRVVIDGTATSIKNIDSEVVESNAPVYNLQGQRVNGNNLTPGIYVKAGKKFVVK